MAKMKVEDLELPKFPKQAIRCAQPVKSNDTFLFTGPRRICGRHARFTINGVPLCRQHAGDAALRNLILQQEKEES